MRRVFGDTSYFIALVVPNDALHARAVARASNPMKVVTTAWVMAELATYLSHPSNRPLFGAILDAVRNEPTFEFIPATPDLFDAGVDLFRSRADKGWSLVDCISFVIMQRERLTEALTGDHHFTQAGLTALLLDD